MPTSRRTKSATNSRVCINTGAQHLSPSVPPRPFPIFQYASIVGVHAILFGFTALYLPQSTRLLMTFDARVTDRPQSIFMETLTVCPPVTAAWVCLGLCVLQPWWAGWMDKWYCNDRRAKDTTNEVNVERAKYHWLWLLKLRDATTFTLLSALVAQVAIILFGAPLFSHCIHTSLLAFTIAILTVFTPSFLLGCPTLGSDTLAVVRRFTWIRLFVEFSPRNAVERAIVYPSVGTALGAWLGAFPIPLDWGRPWQAWPLTPLYGSLVGYLVGSLGSLSVNLVDWFVKEDTNIKLKEYRTE